MLVSIKAEAKPIPCTKPNIKITQYLRLFICVMKIFSIAMKTIEMDINGSIIAGFGSINLLATSTNEIVCANVKKVAWINNGFILGEAKNKPNTNKIWSNPRGIICLKPSSIKLITTSNMHQKL